MTCINTTRLPGTGYTFVYRTAEFMETMYEQVHWVVPDSFCLFVSDLLGTVMVFWRGAHTYITVLYMKPCVCNVIYS